MCWPINKNAHQPSDHHVFLPSMSRALVPHAAAFLDEFHHIFFLNDMPVTFKKHP